MCRSVLVDRDLEGQALVLAPFVRWSLSRLLTWFRRPVMPLGSRIAGCYLDCERWPTTLSDGRITTIISIYCKDRRGISTDPRGEGWPGAESEVCKRFLGCQSDVHQTDWISPESEGTRVFIAFWGGGQGHDVTTAHAQAIITQARGTALTHGWVLFLAPSESLSTGPAGGATKERSCGGRPQLVPPWHTPAVRLVRVYYLNTKIQKCNNQPYNTGTQEMAMTENIGIETHNYNNCGTADSCHHLNTDNDR